MRASRQDGRHPRPQLVRPAWTSLDGPWGFAHDDDDRGEADGWFDTGRADPFDGVIEVPYPPESPASGIGDTGFHPVVWYRRELGPDVLPPLPAGHRMLVHFGAVDRHATVWCDGELVGRHEGGQTPFSVDVTRHVRDGGTAVLVVRAFDDPHDDALPRGKQDWELEPHGIWYERTTGIWQTVWAEPVSPLSIAGLAWSADVDAGVVRCDVELSAPPRGPVDVAIGLSVDDAPLAGVELRLTSSRGTAVIPITQLGDDAARDRLLWSPDQPTLVDADVCLRRDGTDVDQVDSYLGIRDVAVGGGRFLLNGRPCEVRSVLDQGYAHETHLANPGTDRLREDVELILALGFNAARVHQKAEDPRFLYWADRLGLMVWGETANATSFEPVAVEALTREWLDLVRRDRSHPCIVTWVPVNESWGVPDLATDAAQQAYVFALAQLTRALDPSRPVMSNEGWEHVASDILGVHDYSSDPAVLRARYGSRESTATMLSAAGPAGRALALSDEQRTRFTSGETPLMITEFGGVSYAGAGQGWGYATVESDEQYAGLLRSLFDALRDCPEVAGFCYTQLFDTRQETNGLLRADRTPKLPVAVIRQIVTGQD